VHSRPADTASSAAVVAELSLIADGNIEGDADGGSARPHELDFSGNDKWAPRAYFAAL
jgi:hypothetical protein